MLLPRSIFLQAFLLLTVQYINCQDYESSYDVAENSDHVDAEGDSGHPDYSKYYSVDTSAPLISPQGNTEAGFLSPIEFSGFFGPSPLEFGASTKQLVKQPQNPFTVASTQQTGFAGNIQKEFPEFSSGSTYPDYFEAAQRKQKLEASEGDGESQPEIAPGPNYISHHVPASYALEGGYSSDVERVEPKVVKKKSKKDYDKDYEQPNDEDYKVKDYDYPSGKYTNYNTGKSSSTVSQPQPQAPGYYDQYSSTPTTTPYQKYSFQPVSEGFKSQFLDELISTVAPFNPAYNKVTTTATPNFETQPSENVPSHLKGKNCRRVKKHIDSKDVDSGKVKRDAMNCYVCEDAENNSKYTQCSYTDEPEPINDYSGISERYSTPGKHPDGFRYKRYSGDDFNSDPYEYIKKQSQSSYVDAEKTQEDEEYKIPDFHYDYPDKSYSEAESEKIVKNAANCQKIEKSGMTCTVCKDAESGGNYEQCSYTSEPKEQKYAYVAEKKYDSKDDPAEGAESKKTPQNREATDVTKTIEDAKKFDPAAEFNANLPHIESLKHNPADSEDYYKESDKSDEEFQPSEQFKASEKATRKLIDDDPYDIPKHFAETTVNEKKAHVKNLEPNSYESDDSSAEAADDDSSSEKSSPYKDIDEYHYRLFPSEANNEESKQAKVVAKNPSESSNRKDVEEVLLEFSKKDRSACKKAEKNGMTCYLCVDQKGIQHEECMYVSESKPQASHVAYHEVQQIKSPEKSEQIPAASEAKRKRFFKKAGTTVAPFTLEAAASEEHETTIKYKKPVKNRKRNTKRKSAKKEQQVSATHNEPEMLEEDEDDAQPKTPTEFQVGNEEGAYSAETKAVYSKVHGVKLPRYMVEKSEFEKEFDEFAGEF